ncbi:hypothetical protein [Tropicimonas sp.]|uniref:hypothetical protein n=1 Tax=Tropicimonas sp. TaxID=2067044 RepID=UPI003A8499EA
MIREKRHQTILWRFLEPEARVWHGESRLATVFWGYGVLVSTGLILQYIVASMNGRTGLEQALIPVGAIYTMWILVAIWRNSANAHPYWGTLARWLTVVWALNSIFVLSFLQLELLVRYAGK